MDPQFSPSTKQFYWPPAPAPEDATEIPLALHDEMIAARDAGKQIDAGPGGLPVAIDPPATPEPSPEEALQAEREAMQPSRLQCRLAMIEEGVLDQAEAAVAAADQITQEAWAAAQYFRRLSPLVLGMIANLGWAEEFADDLFRLALTKEV